MKHQQLIDLFADDPEALKLISWALDREVERLELERRAHPDDPSTLVELKKGWQLQSDLFRLGGL